MHRMIKAALTAGLSLAAAPVLAQASSYLPGSVWQVSDIKTEPGQFENYIDYLGGNWRKELEYQKKLGYVLSYHVFAVNSPRRDEPDLILAVEYKDYVPNAEQLAIQKKIEAMMQEDAHKSDSASGERKSMRTTLGSMELQELKLK
ncbi:MAG: hypothetical protein JOY99_16590 [Sphingomonadaceae bacterium]|nr:hypothetical protein [Sphingomonadaceae bacterium]